MQGRADFSEAKEFRVPLRHRVRATIPWLLSTCHPNLQTGADNLVDTIFEGLQEHLDNHK